MAICLTHNQAYNHGEYCVYCGSPYRVVTSTSSTLPVRAGKLKRRSTEKDYMNRYHEVKGKRKYTKKVSNSIS